MLTARDVPVIVRSICGCLCLLVLLRLNVLLVVEHVWLEVCAPGTVFPVDLVTGGALLTRVLHIRDDDVVSGMLFPVGADLRVLKCLVPSLTLSAVMDVRSLFALTTEAECVV